MAFLLLKSLSMADLAHTHSSELHLIWQEIQGQADQLSKYHLEAQSEVDALKLKVATLVDLLEQIFPGFQEKYSNHYLVKIQSYNPEMED